jgi:hypothetical protein
VPAEELLNDQMNPVEFVAFDAYVVVVVAFVNWHIGSLPSAIVIAVGVPTGGVTVTEALPVTVLGHPSPPE